MPEDKDDELSIADKIKQALLDLDPNKARKGAEIEDVEDRDSQEKDLELDEDEQDTIVRSINEMIKQEVRETKDKRAGWELADKAYKAKMKPRTFPFVGASSIPIGYVKSTTRTIAREVTGAINQYGTPWPLEPFEKDDIKRTEKTELFINSDAKKNQKIELQQYLVSMDTSRYGSGVMKMVMVNEVEKVTEVVVYNGQKEAHIIQFMEHYPNAETKYPDYFKRIMDGETLVLDVSWEKTIRRGPMGTRVARPKVHTPPGYTDENKLPWFFEEMEMSWADLEKGRDEGKYEDRALEIIKGKYSNEKDPYEYTKKTYTVYEGMWKYPIRAGVREKCMFTVVGKEEAFLRGIQYPFKHGRSYLIWHRFLPQGDDIDGESLALDAEPTQRLLFQIFNNTIDSDMYNTPTFKIKTGKGYNLAIEKYYPGKKWAVQDMNDIDIMKANASSANSLNLMGVAQRFGGDLLSVSEGYSGRESQRDPDAPAKKTQMLLQMAGRGIGFYLKNYLLGHNEVGIQQAELWSQYGTAGAEFRMLNEKGVASMVAAPDDLRIRLDMNAHAGEGAFSREAKKVGLDTLLQRMEDSAFMQQVMEMNPEGQRELWIRLIGTWDPTLSKIAHLIMPPLDVLKERQVEIKKEAIRRILQEEAQAQMQGGAQEAVVEQPGGEVPAGVPPMGGEMPGGGAPV